MLGTWHGYWQGPDLKRSLTWGEVRWQRCPSPLPLTNFTPAPSDQSLSVVGPLLPQLQSSLLPEIQENTHKRAER